MRCISLFSKLSATLLLIAATTGLAMAKDVDYKCEAPEPSPCPCLHDGFYVGAAVGYDIVTSRARFDEMGTIAVTGNPHFAATGWDGGLFLGYGQYIDCFYLGGEIFGYYSGASQSLNINTPLGSLHSNIRANGNYGLAILPGLRINNATTAYVRIGYDWANVKSHTTVTIPGLGLAFSGSRNNTRSGWLWGIGLETLIDCNWSLRADYTYVNYTSSNHHTGSSARNPADNRIALGLVYHIC